MSTDILRSRKSDEYPTPQAIFDECDARYGPLLLDAAATYENTKCRRLLTAIDNSLAYPWWGRVWCNPPYSLTRQFVEHAIRQVAVGNAELVVMLLPSNTATRWWREAYEHADEVLLISGKLKFGESKHTAPTGSTIFVFRRRPDLPWDARNPNADFTMPTRHGSRERWFTIKPSSGAAS